MFARKICVGMLPHAGLGNKLFIWAQARIFAEANNCEYFTIGWSHFHLRTLIKILLRKEKRHEYYTNPFKFNLKIKNLPSILFSIVNSRKYLSQEDCENVVKENKIYIFSGMLAPPHYFNKLLDHREFIVKCFNDSLRKEILRKIKDYEIPDIGVHIRKGDFIELGRTTPVSYFKNCIEQIRHFVGYAIPVTIFTNANEKYEDIKELLNMPYVTLPKEDIAIVHLVLLSKSKVIITSPHSTFGFWAAFVSEAIIINTDGAIRGNDINKRIYEGTMPASINQWPVLLSDNLGKLKNQV
jgi:hypothetical protein